MFHSSSSPLGLRMREGRPLKLSERHVNEERSKVMLNLDESIYSCSDYIGRRSIRDRNTRTSEQTDTEIPELSLFLHDKVDTICREKMCEWSYRVCDHFHAEREIVAVSFSFLDRFIDKCSCDRSAFKLVAITTLYMANKICGGPHGITINALASLSRGEFETSHIAEMEIIILKTLDWRLNPPTAQCFINSFYCYVPALDGYITNAIYQRAIFFAELALYDYAFATKERSLIAVASLMNAMEGMEDISTEEQGNFVDVIDLKYDLNFTTEIIDAVRNRLWYVYSMSAQYKEDDAIVPDLVKNDTQRKQISSSPSSSPVSVATNVDPTHPHIVALKQS